jgi:Fe-S cluster assembly iron-binding protein IscA
MDTMDAKEMPYRLLVSFVPIVVSETSNGQLFHYDMNLLTRGFVFQNPNAKTSCGCGSSFGA